MIASVSDTPRGGALHPRLEDDDGKEEEKQTQEALFTTSTSPEEKVLGCPETLQLVLSFLPAPEDIGRCAAVSKSFRTACSSEVVWSPHLDRAFPVADALQKSRQRTLSLFSFAY
jgi:hypothetical protein